jgi:hypothetical protein
MWQQMGHAPQAYGTAAKASTPMREGDCTGDDLVKRNDTDIKVESVPQSLLTHLADSYTSEEDLCTII